MYYLISYDITSNKLRKKISDLLEEKGVRIQYSVFQFVLGITELNVLKKKLSCFELGKKDSIAIIPICAHCKEKIEYWGNAYSLIECKVLIA